MPQEIGSRKVITSMSYDRYERKVERYSLPIGWTVIIVFFAMAQLIMLGLRLTKFANYNWFLILSPIWIGVCVSISIFLFAYLYFLAGGWNKNR